MQKRGLGRGLAALISDAGAGADAGVREVSLALITANPMQPRTLFDPIKLQELAESIREHGVLQPVLVRSVGHDRYQVVAGERRLRAAEMAGLATIPALVKVCSDREQLEIAMVENLQREDIGPIETARAYRQMAEEFDMTQEAIAARVGKSRAAVANTMGLLDLPPEVQESLEVGQITEGHARALKGLKNAHEIVAAWRTVVLRGLSVRAAENLAREARQETKDPARAPEHKAAADPNESYLINRLQERLQTRVTLRRMSHTTGRIEIEFYSDEDLDRVLEKLTNGE